MCLNGRALSESIGKLGRNWLKGALGDALHAVLSGADHNLRMIPRKLRLLYPFALGILLNLGIAIDVTA